jgi:uncharacterized membrane protein YkoI
MTALIVFCLLETAARGAGEDHDAAQRSLEMGEIKPRDQIFATVKSRLPGDIVSVEIEHCGPAWGYGLRVLDREGRIRCVTVDAKSGQI